MGTTTKPNQEGEVAHPGPARTVVEAQLGPAHGPDAQLLVKDRIQGTDL